MPPILAAQHFAGNLLVRGIAGRKLEAILASDQPQEFALVADRRIAIAGGGGSGAGSSNAAEAVRWLDRAGLAAIDLFHVSGEQLCLRPAAAGPGSSGSPGAAPQPAKGASEAATLAAAAAGEEEALDDCSHQAAGGGSSSRMDVPVYFLGEDLQRHTLRLAVDVSGAPQGWAERRQVRLQDLRSLMPVLPPAELAIAGHAMALSQWHQAHLFCGRCGAPSVPADGGSRRQCTRDPSHRSYPRTDPVCIMLVESPDGRSALLGRSKKMRPSMLTCLSGFCDQGEGIEEAVCRETWEEAGVQVVAVDIVGSQPWPVGRGGSCELMIGCIAKAGGEAITVDPEEMEEVQWVSREDVAEAVRQSDSPGSPYLGGKGSEAGRKLGFFVPPPFAIAHHLMRRWVQHEGPWFPQQQQQQGRGQKQAAAQPAPVRPSNL